MPSLVNSLYLILIPLSCPSNLYSDIHKKGRCHCRRGMLEGATLILGKTYSIAKGATSIGTGHCVPHSCSLGQHTWLEMSRTCRSIVCVTLFFPPKRTTDVIDGRRRGGSDVRS